MSRKEGSGDFSLKEHAKDLCNTPAVDETYLSDLRSRVDVFVAQQKLRSDGGTFRRKEALKNAAVSLRQQRAKDVLMVHGTVLDMVATHLGVEYKEVLDGLLDSEQQVELLSGLLTAGGKAALLFSYILLPPPFLDCGRGLPDDTPPFRRVVVTDGTSEPLKDKSVLVFRVNTNINIDASNVCEELIFTPIEAEMEDNVVGSLERSLGLSAADPIRTSARWGELLRTPTGFQTRKFFLGQVTAFQDFLSTTKDDLVGRLEFVVPEGIMRRIEGYPNPETILKSDIKLGQDVENLVKQWFKKIEQVMEGANCVRAERDDLGPRAELEFWRSSLTKFTSILDFLSSPSVKLALAAVHNSRNSYVQKWPWLADKVENACNEATNNVKYLDDLNELSQALYTTPPPGLAEHLRSILYSIRIMFGCSRYYNTTERATALLVKVTNQVVVSFREYLTDARTRSIWSFPKRELIARIKICLDVYETYRRSFTETQKAMLENPKEKEFGCSEVNVFVRLASFCARLEKIRDALETYLELSVLHSSCFENVEKLTGKLESVFKDLVSDPNDPLNDRRPYFDNSYKIFQERIAELENDIYVFCLAMVAHCTNVATALTVLGRFSELKLSCLCLDVEYLKQLQALQGEICALRDRYNEDREHVPLPWTLPPIAGRIAWARHLLHKIEDPMNVFKLKERVLVHPRAQHVIRQYNSLCKVLLQYEVEHHEVWCCQLQVIDSLLEAPVLRRENLVLKVNWYPYLDEIVCETEAMWKMGLPVPDEAAILQIGHKDLLRTCDVLNHLVARYNTLRRGVLRMYLPLLRPQLERLDTFLDPGQEEISWVSLEVSSFCDNVSAALTNLERFLDALGDMRTSRIEEPMGRVAATLLVKLTAEDPLPASQLLSINAEARHGLVKELNTVITAAESAAIEIVNRFVDCFDVPSVADVKYQWLDGAELVQHFDSVSEVPISDHLAFRRWERPNEADLPRFHRDCMRVYASMFRGVVDALLAATVTSLETLRSRVMDEDMSTPLLAADLGLNIPNITLEPSLDQMQAAILELTRTTLHMLLGLTMWGLRPEPVSAASGVESDDRPRPPRSQASYFKLISENKEVVRLVQSMQGAILLFKSDVSHCIEAYASFSYLWEKNIVEEVENFMRNDPEFYAIEEEVKRFVGFSRDVESLPDQHDVACMRLSSVNVKTGLSAKALEWRLVLGKKLVTSYSKKMKSVQDFIKERQKVLCRHINDLDDVRLAMACLEMIRSTSIEMNAEISRIEDTFNLLVIQSLEVPAETLRSVDTLRYEYITMCADGRKVQETLLNLQDPFKKQLLERLEAFKEDEERFHKEFEESGPTVPGLSAREANDRVTILMMGLDSLMERWERISDGERLFGLPVSDFPDLTERKKQMQVLNRLYSLYEQVLRSINKYLAVPWGEMDVETMSNDLNDFQTRYKKLPKSLMEFSAYAELVQSVDALREVCPLLELLAHPAMRDRHWARLTQLTGHEFPFESFTFCLRDVVQAPLLFHKESVEDICISAQKEREVEAKLKSVVSEWQAVQLSFAAFKTRGELLLKGQETREIISQLEDSLMILSSLFTNRYNTPFKKDIQIWLKRLAKTSETLENWLQVQNLWLYLEAVFVSGDIARQLAQEAKRFSMIDKTWVRIMTRARDVGTVVDVAGDETTSQMLMHLLEQLEACQKSLTGYLETLRCAFPRFFFVSDPTLLEILGQASDCHTIQGHLLNIFENVFLVEFDEKVYDRIVGMYSREMEHIKFEEPVSATGSVEQWLSRLLIAAHRSLNDVIADAAAKLAEPDAKIVDLLNKYPAQVGLLAIQFLWTRDSEAALRRSRVDRRVMRDTNAAFLSLLNLLIEQTTRDLTKVERTKFETLVTIHVHQRDMFDELTRRRIRSPLDFEWLKNMRFYWREDDEEAWVIVTDVSFLYQNEFMGCTERLVITPLTDRCYITLAQAVGMSMGGAPAGPAGTGKTETTKDMAKALGKYCVVFNCSDQMDFRGLGRIFKGLAQSGTWGCFDEFNRIELPVLSVAAQQISIVLTARKERKHTFIFSDGDSVPMNMELGIFITMNPGYAGRQELPENLKMMFRPIAMMVPDRQIIMRVKLAACGFKENQDLARKFFTLYRLCEEQLSKQVHYDFGLRNILSVLRTLGAQKRANPSDSEETTVMSVLRYMNVSKLVDEDEPLFTALVDDLFPGSRVKGSSQRELQKSIAQACTDLGLVNHPAWNLKLVQLFETSLVRHGLMVLGPTGAGKTTCTRALMLALSINGTPHRELRMNPKAITAPQMFGRLDVATNDWTDGIFSTLWRRTLKVPKTESTWLVLDGPVDAVWIENLNSVLDDNKTLTLANGDRITMAPNCKLLFEPDNVTNASPATVSRMGMVFLSASVMPWMPILKGWLLKRPSHEASMLEPLFLKIYPDLQTHLTTKLHPAMIAADAIYIRQCCDLLDGLLRYSPSTQNLSAVHWERLFLFALMWSLGALLELPDRDKMEAFVRGHASKLNWPKPGDGFSIFEYFVDEVGYWQHWSTRVEEYLYPEDWVPDYLSILVPNIDNVRTAYLIKTLASLGKSVLLIGEQGTAKTVMMKSYLSELDPEYHLNKTYNFSSATTPNMVQRIIESYVEKRVGSKFGPPGGRQMTVFIDDLSMPVVNEWGDQVTNELLRQLMEAGGFYSLDRPGDFSIMADLHLVAAMIHPGGGRNDIPPRLKRQFDIFNCTLPSDRSIDKIFAVIAEGYFCPSRFGRDVVALAPRLVPLTRAVWQVAKTTMLPTPAKFHYVFNLRDLSRIWQGILTVTQDGCDTRAHFLELWRHECQRVISDRFVTLEEQKWFAGRLSETAARQLGAAAQTLSNEDRYFADFLRDAPEPTGDEPDDFSLDPPKIYELVPSWEILVGKLKEYLVSYNETVRGSKLDLVFFMDAMRHLLIISRTIRTPRGSMVLVGVGGSGKQSLTKLASHIAGYKTFQIAVTRSYNVSNFLEDLKILYRIAGQQGQGVTFLFSENDIKDETFLEYLNNVLSAGEVANLFTKEEMEEIANNLIPTMKKEHPRRAPTLDSLYDYFITRSQSNLHVILCFSPVGPKFRSRTLKFPGLISGCTIDWFQKWPSDALVAVSDHVLADFPIVCTPAVKAELVAVMAEAHEVTSDACIQYYDRFRRLTHVTPKSFLSLLGAYKNMYNARMSTINTLNTRMTAGVQKLNEAAEGVDVLKKELELKEKDIAVASAAANEVLAEVTKKAQATEKVKTELQVVKERAEALVSDIAQETMIAESRLLAAKPALMAAEAALQTIKATDIATVRKLGKPPYLITVIMDVVLILFQRKLSPIVFDDERNFMTMSWSESLKVMADPRFLQKLQNFPKDKINAETIDIMRPYLSLPDYTFEKAKASSGNVAGLIQWTRAMADFYHVNKEVLPLKANLAIQQTKLAGAQKQLGDAQQLLDGKQRELDEVQLVFNVAHGKQQAVLKDAMACKMKMDMASALINGLTGERQRWSDQLAQFSVETARLVGDAMVLTAFLCYSGPFNQEFREMLRTKWTESLEKRKIPTTANLNLANVLTDAATIGEWNVFGLPSDELSVQNGILVCKAPRYPLLIDPQTQGKNWIKNMEKDNELQVTGLNDRYFRNYLEDCVNLGRPLLIEDVEEELDPVLDHVLEKNYVKMGTSLKVKVGDKEVDVHPDFRLFITTKFPNPAFSPEIAARTAVIDFTVTMKGLEEQLLGRVIISEQNELEVERLNLVKGVTMNRREMEELEAGLLQKLSTVEGSLVEDESLVKMLNVSKDTAAGLRVKLEVGQKTEEKLNLAREAFRPVATRGSILYFLITDMALVNCMYQTSLAQFLERFDLSLERSEKHLVSTKRIQLINDYLTYEVFCYQTRGLYVVNKFMFALLLALKVDLQRGAVTYDEFQCLVKGGAALDLHNVAPKPCVWISDPTWLNLVQLSTVRPFQHIVDQVAQAEHQWRVWFFKEAPEDEPLPEPYHHLDVVKRLLLVRAWCPDRTFSAGRQYIRHALGPRFAEPVILRMEKMLGESRPDTPLLCLLSPGSDPTPQVERMARSLLTSCRAVSMGQGQEVHARRLLERSMAEGGWVLLQNCHLGLDYMSELALSLIGAETIHPDFRLFLTTDVHCSFPISLLQISIKYTNEAPQGVRAGLQRTYADLSEDTLELSDASAYLPLLFTTSFFHTVVQERRKFGPLGWNIPYEFNSSDWLASVTFVRQHLDSLDKHGHVSWQTLRYMIGEIQYGGRVTDDFDKRVLNTLTRHWFNDAVVGGECQLYQGYPVLRFKTLAQYQEALEGFPDPDPPQVCGLHPNANIAFQTNGTRDMMLSIISIQPKQGGAVGGGTREQRVTHLVSDMLAKLPPNYDPHETRQRLQDMGSLTPMVIFLRQEIDRMRIVLKLVKRSLQDLLLAIEGSIIMNEALSNAMDSIDDASVPAVWLRGSWASSTLGFWFTELLERNQQFSAWLAKGRPAHFWMTGFFNPQGFLTAMRQEVARANKGWALDVVVLHNTVLRQTREELSKPPTEGVVVYGLFLEGAGWDKRNSRLIESPAKVLSVPMPLIHINAINTSFVRKDPTTDLYQCPVYKKPQRTDLTYITTLYLGTSKPADHWVMRGVALLCDTK